MIDAESANSILSLFGKRLRVFPIEQAVEELRAGQGPAVVIESQDDYTEFVLAFLQTRITDGCS